jgi:hypothetical protein
LQIVRWPIPGRSKGVVERKHQNMSAILIELGLPHIEGYKPLGNYADGRPRPADRVEQVSLTRGDFEGFDILSFDTAGTEQLIEVKTTRYGAYTPFFVTRNEVDRSNVDSDRYHLYRVFAFRKEPKLFRLPGPVDRSCQLDPAQYVARVG